MSLSGRGAAQICGEIAMGGKPSRNYGAAVHVERRHGHLIERMPWPTPCRICGGAASVQVDGRRLCRVHSREVLR